MSYYSAIIENGVNPVIIFHMDNLLITNEHEAEQFKNLLLSYFVDNCVSYSQSEHLHKFYKEDGNLQFINNSINNNRSAVIALSCSDYEFLELLLTSDKIKEKKYNLSNLSKTLEKNTEIEPKFGILIANCFMKHKEIFEDCKYKAKEQFIESFTTYCMKNDDFLNNHQDFFFDFLKKNKINPYSFKSSIPAMLIENNKMKTLDYLIDSAKNDADKERIIVHTIYWDYTTEMEDYLAMKRKSHEAFKNYKNLHASIHDKTELSQPKRLKV